MIKKLSITNHQSLITNRGFTLIELLVVISILGVLAALVLSNMAGVRERARDAQRKSDLKEIQKALEMYKQNQDVPSYPTAADWSALVAILDGNSGSYIYMKKVPDDPLEGDNHYSYARSTDPLDYTLRACLENKSDPQGEADAVNCLDSEVKFELSAP